MTHRLSEDDVIARVTRLTRSQLVQFVAGNLVRPEPTAAGAAFGHVDIARLELLCDLSQDLDLDETCLAIVVSLIDQVHAARHDLAILARAIDGLPDALKSQIIAQLRQRPA
jgi:chaperone modulatory protein CbpM